MFTLQKKYFDNRDIYIVHNRISKKKLVPHLNLLRNIDHKPNKYLYTYMCQKLFTEFEERKINNRRSVALIFYINNNRLYLGYTGNSFKISRGLFLFFLVRSTCTNNGPACCGKTAKSAPDGHTSVSASMTSLRDLH